MGSSLKKLFLLARGRSSTKKQRNRNKKPKNRVSLSLSKNNRLISPLELAINTGRRDIPTVRLPSKKLFTILESETVVILGPEGGTSA
jgi:hypothetical protein